MALEIAHISSTTSGETTEGENEWPRILRDLRRELKDVGMRTMENARSRDALLSSDDTYAAASQLWYFNYEFVRKVCREREWPAVVVRTRLPAVCIRSRS